jgi:ABC-type Fe3+/spermidine/putrescine transport system ATPase subunit
MSDRIAVMSEGHIEQLGTPAEVYETPVSTYVAEFLGVSNLMEATVVECRSDCTIVDLAGHRMTANALYPETGQALLSIRPERVQLQTGATVEPNQIPATVDRTVYAGSLLSVLISIDGVGELQVVIANEGGTRTYQEGQAVTVRFPEDALRVLAPSSFRIEDLDLEAADGL